MSEEVSGRAKRQVCLPGVTYSPSAQVEHFNCWSLPQEAEGPKFSMSYSPAIRPNFPASQDDPFYRWCTLSHILFQTRVSRQLGEILHDEWEGDGSKSPNSATSLDGCLTTWPFQEMGCRRQDRALPEKSLPLFLVRVLLACISQPFQKGCVCLVWGHEGLGEKIDHLFPLRPQGTRSQHLATRAGGQGMLAWNMECTEILPYAGDMRLINIWTIFF